MTDTDRQSRLIAFLQRGTSATKPAIANTDKVLGFGYDNIASYGGIPPTGGNTEGWGPGLRWLLYAAMQVPAALPYARALADFILERLCLRGKLSGYATNQPHNYADIWGGAEMQAVKRGNYDTAVVTFAAGAGTIPEALGGGKVVSIRSAYTTDTTFDGPWYWANLKTGTEKTVAGFVNGATTTTVTLTDSGFTGDAQLYFVYSNGDILAKYDLFHVDTSPCLTRASVPAGNLPEWFYFPPSPYFYQSYCDGDQWIIQGLMELAGVTADTSYSDAATEIYEEFIALTTTLSDTIWFLAPSTRSYGWAFADADDRVTMTVTDDGYLSCAYTAGTFGQIGWGQSPIGDWTENDSALAFNTYGLGDGKRTKLVLFQSASPPYANTDLYSFGWWDDKEGARTITAHRADFVRHDGIKYDADRNPGGLGDEHDLLPSDDPTTVVTVETDTSKAGAVDGTQYDRYARSTIALSAQPGAYGGPTVGGYTFAGRIRLIACATGTLGQLQVEVWDGNTNTLLYTLPCDLTATPTQFDSGAAAFVGTGTYIKLLFYQPAYGTPDGKGGMLFFTAVTDAPYTTYPNGTTPINWQFERWDDGAGEWRIGNLVVTENHPVSYGSGVVLTATGFNATGLDPWMGAWQVGWQNPAVHYDMGFDAYAEECVSFLRDAQLKYQTDFAVLGPFYPTRLAPRPENASLGEANAWYWGESTWAEYHYRPLMNVAEYYYKSGSANAKQVLDDYFAWLAGWFAVPHTYPPDRFYSSGTVTEATDSHAYYALLVRAARYYLGRAANANVTSVLTAMRTLLYADQITDDTNAKYGAFAISGNPVNPVWTYEQAWCGLALAPLTLTPQRVNSHAAWSRWGFGRKAVITEKAATHTAFYRDFFWNDKRYRE